MGWRSVVITQPAYLSLQNGQFSIELTDQQKAHIPLEDINTLVLDHYKITISQSLLSALANAGVALLVVDRRHLPSGIFLPYLPYHRGLRRLRAQLALPRPTIKRWQQQIIRQKVLNQSETLRRVGKLQVANDLEKLAQAVRAGDPNHCEAQAAQAYFRVLLNTPLKRREDCLFNTLLNYGYAVLRACIARQISGSGLHPSIGLFHNNEQNSFNLADDLIEPYRPLLDHWVYQHFANQPQRNLLPKDKGILVHFLNQDIGNNQNTDQSTVLAHIEMSVQSFAVACESPNNALLWLATHPQQNKNDE